MAILTRVTVLWLQARLHHAPLMHRSCLSRNMHPTPLAPFEWPAPTLAELPQSLFVATLLLHDKQRQLDSQGQSLQLTLIVLSLQALVVCSTLLTILPSNYYDSGDNRNLFPCSE